MSAVAKTLATMRRMAQQTALTDTCTIFRKTGNTMTSGIAKPAYDAGTATKCQFIPGERAEEVVAEGKTTMVAREYFILPVATSLTNADYIQYGTATFDITEAPPVSALDATLVVQVRRRK